MQLNWNGYARRCTGGSGTHPLCCWHVRQLHSGDSSCALRDEQTSVHVILSSPTSYARNQRLYAAQAIHQEYIRTRDLIIDDVSKAKDVILCGDGRMDSPGFCATKATYSWKGVLNMEHGDKRRVHAFVYTVYNSQHPHCHNNL